MAIMHVTRILMQQNQIIQGDMDHGGIVGHVGSCSQDRQYDATATDWLEEKARVLNAAMDVNGRFRGFPPE
eukprot:scaffold127175_cov52-Attheya_sp.AAC.2